MRRVVATTRLPGEKSVRSLTVMNVSAFGLWSTRRIPPNWDRSFGPTACACTEVTTSGDYRTMARGRAANSSTCIPLGKMCSLSCGTGADRRDLKPQYEFVVTRLRSAFPEVFWDLDFDVAGLTVTVDLIDANSNKCPLALAPDGWITGLLHLTAVAGATTGSLIAVDDFGNDLHPFAIRELTQAFRVWADERDLTVCLASHSPVLLDEFKDEPASVFVMEHGLEKCPVPLTDLYETDWLARFSLGRLYEHGEFAGQRRRADNGAALGQHGHQAK